MHIKFDDKALNLMCHKITEQGSSVSDFCSQLLKSYEYGLKLIQQNTGQTSFVLHEDVVRDPGSTLEKLIKDSYLLTEKTNKSEYFNEESEPLLPALSASRNGPSPAGTISSYDTA